MLLSTGDQNQAYQLGDEAHDGVCTSLDGPRCDPAEKKEYLAQQRSAAQARAARAASSDPRLSVKTTKEFKFERGEQVGAKQAREILSQRGEQEPVVIFKSIRPGDDLEDVFRAAAEQVRRVVMELEDDEDDGDDGGEARAREPPRIATVRPCFAGGALQGSEVCSHGRDVLRCTQDEGNPMKVEAGCFTAERSTPVCGPGAQLCSITSPRALAQFSSPEPCEFHHKDGFVPDDPRQDMLIADMTWAQARAWCDANHDCAAFTFADKERRPMAPTTVWFKRISFTDPGGRGWHTYVKKCPKPSNNRFSYLDALDGQALEWLRAELRDQLAYAERLLLGRAASAGPRRPGAASSWASAGRALEQRLAERLGRGRAGGERAGGERAGGERAGGERAGGDAGGGAGGKGAGKTGEQKAGGEAGGAQGAGSRAGRATGQVSSWGDAYRLLKASGEFAGEDEEELREMATKTWAAVKAMARDHTETVSVALDDRPEQALRKGARVEARWKGGREWFPGVIKSENEVRARPRPPALRCLCRSTRRLPTGRGAWFVGMHLYHTGGGSIASPLLRRRRGRTGRFKCNSTTATSSPRRRQPGCACRSGAGLAPVPRGRAHCSTASRRRRSGWPGSCCAASTSQSPRRARHA
jgi:hypothetical protein